MNILMRIPRMLFSGRTSVSRVKAQVGLQL